MLRFLTCRKSCHTAPDFRHAKFTYPPTIAASDKERAESFLSPRLAHSRIVQSVGFTFWFRVFDFVLILRRANGTTCRKLKMRIPQTERYGHTHIHTQIWPKYSNMIWFARASSESDSIEWKAQYIDSALADWELVVARIVWNLEEFVLGTAISSINGL